jgi:hypothetical protein
MGMCSSSAKVAAVDRTTTTNASSLFIAAPDSAAYYSEENSNDTFDAFTREEPSSLHAMPFVVRPKVCYEINLPRIEEGSRIVEDDSPVLGSHCIGDEAIIGAVSTSAVTNTVTTATYSQRFSTGASTAFTSARHLLGVDETVGTVSRCSSGTKESNTWPVNVTPTSVTPTPDGGGSPAQPVPRQAWQADKQLRSTAE